MLALTTESLKGYGLNRIFELLKESGFDGVDLTFDPKSYDSTNADYIKSLIETYDMPVLSIETPYNATTKSILQAIELAKVIDCKVVVIQPPKILNFKYSNWLKSEVPKIRQKENISIALQNAPNTTWMGVFPEHGMNNLSELKKFKHACLDTSLLNQKSEDILHAYRTLKKYLVHLHLSNVNKTKEYQLPYKGTLPLESLLTKLHQDEFPGTISIKVKPNTLHAGKDKKVIEELKKCKEFYDTYFAKK